jgi:hypothetical protein
LDALQQWVLLYDKQEEEHYHLISALHKSIRTAMPMLRSMDIDRKSAPKRIAGWGAPGSHQRTWDDDGFFLCFL